MTPTPSMCRGCFRRDQAPGTSPPANRPGWCSRQGIGYSGEVESIGRAIHDQAWRAARLLLDVKPNVPWVRLAQRVPVRIRLLAIPRIWS